MRLLFKYLLIGFTITLAIGLKHAWAEPLEQADETAASLFGAAQMVGRIQNTQLVECSGMDISRVHDNLLWAINDGGNGPYLYALGRDGRDRGRLRVIGAKNRDWEGLDTFMWQNRPMILIADVGDNHQQFGKYTLYVVEEPQLDDERLDPSTVIEVAWQIDFIYPDRSHDAEGVAVDLMQSEVLILTKRDDPPGLFVLPLMAASTGQLSVARSVTTVDQIPPPTSEDRRQPYGNYRSQPTALDLSGNGLLMAVLTYKHAYLFQRRPGETWAAALSLRPTLVPLPLPQATRHFGQREAVCFSMNDRSLLVSSEGQGPGIFQMTLR